MTPETLAATLGVLAAAMAGVAVLMARTYVQVMNILQGLHRSGVSMRGGTGGNGGTTPIGSPLPARTSTAPRAVTLPQWDQLNDPLPTGQADPYAATDCGEECVAEIVYAVRGVPLSAGDVRYLLGGPARIGLTNAADLVRALGICHVRAEAHSHAWDQAMPVIQTAVRDNRYAIALGDWDAPNMLHWVNISSAGSVGMMVSDPWHGKRRYPSNAELSQAFAGWWVEILERGQYTS